MKSLSLILLLLLTVGTVHAEELPGAPSPLSSKDSPALVGTPTIEVPERSHNLGKISPDRQYEHAFTVRNIGTGVLEIEKVIVACGCELIYYDKTIPPGSEGAVIIGFDPRKCTGAIRKYAIIKNNDPTNFSFWVRLTWDP
ncbi:MAG: DUF1573 domain-containing protein [Syntrophobacteraceae bacterium]